MEQIHTNQNTAADEDQLPPMNTTSLDGLLRLVSIEANQPSDDSSHRLIHSMEHKTIIQELIKQHVTAAAATTKTTPSMNTATTIDSDSNTFSISITSSTPFSPATVVPVSTPTAVSANSDSLPPPSSSMSLLRALSEAAASGLISQEAKHEIKTKLVYHYSLTTQIERPTTRLVRTIEEHEEKLDTSYINPQECQEMQREECEALQAIYDEDCVNETTLRASHSSASSSTSTSSTTQPTSLLIRILPYPGQRELNAVSLQVRFRLPTLYPYVRPSFEIVKIEGKLVDSDGLMISTEMNNKLNMAYQKEPLSANEVKVCLFDIINSAQDFLVEYMEFLNDREYQAQLVQEQERKKKELQAAQEHAAAVLEHLNSKTLAAQPQVDHHDYSKALDPAAMERHRLEREHALAEAKRLEKHRLEQERGRLEKERRHIAELEKRAGVLLEDIMVSPDELAEYCYAANGFSGYGEGASLRGFYFEPIAYSPFLVYRFLKLRHKYKQDALVRKELDHQVKSHIQVSIAFHGANADIVPSIVTNGLVVPGQPIDITGKSDRVLGHRTDSGWYGEGIYVTPDPVMALSYGNWGAVFVCLVLRGRSYECPRNDGCGLKDGYESHHNGSEWVLFNNAAVLPIYIIHGVSNAIDGHLGYPLNKPLPYSQKNELALPLGQKRYKHFPFVKGT